MAKYRCWVGYRDGKIVFYDEEEYGLEFAERHLWKCTAMSDEEWDRESGRDDHPSYFEAFLAGDWWWPMELEVDDDLA